ncbi:MAG: hypothetical protein KME05_12660 [Gloeocapsa sp. UFS-A4-WI-NPMV-4B04]|jgi:hypothetical protein|nr:hypothetical protein [Gloeocapsa sp. UFS-A4-WI-NPMV-4B04]
MLVLPKYNLKEDAIKVKNAETEEDLKALMIGPNPGNNVEMGIFNAPTQQGLQKQLETSRRLLKEGKEVNDDTKIYTQKRLTALVYTAASLNNIELT